MAKHFTTTTLLVLIVGVMLISCQSGRELHYFKEGPNYYRLKINEYAFLSRSRYVSGYFDEVAVDRSFGEIYRADSITFISEPSPVKADSSSENALKRDESAKLVMILSTNSDVVAEQIGSLAKNEETLELMARLANKDVIQDNQNLKIQKDEIVEKNSSLIIAANTFINTIDTNLVKTDSLYLAESIRSFLNHLTATNGENVILNNLKEAEIWYKTRFVRP
ncbi:MAG: hypothetical protein IPL46_25665 [Saprospiraceae bacterium]|nr:hypothetical protein [Saprospiraceae bacterium]